MYCWPQELVYTRAHSHLCGCSGNKDLRCPINNCLKKDRVVDALSRFVVLFFDKDQERVPTSKAWEFVGPSICFCIFVLSM